ncbi:uncharacterized protein VP01_2922g1 [Puccinia sorghi]|uniref:Retrovirus-related Pol polyprotein from transposon TNT 1-94-like beta-barrel domain-containing protein n=1 Tax=Puccinia sorghi TaxID=27349 RepID=A0A0L6V193_9BASI|nr:uncharacterized protein VP01_2922g1 [Puccinia sorghi]
MVFGANNSSIPIVGMGTSVIHASTGPVTIHNVFYAPSLSNSLISLTRFFRQGYSINTTHNGSCFVCRKNQTNLLVGSTVDNLLIVDLQHHKALTATKLSPPQSSHRHKALTATVAPLLSPLDIHCEMGHSSFP